MTSPSNAFQKKSKAIIAAVIGGALLTDGYGSAVGAFFGSVIFGLVIGLSYTDIDQDWSQVFLGSMLLVAVVFNNAIRRRADMAGPIIEMRDVAKQYGNVVALAGVSFDVGAGECHCLLGDNGVGKFTFIKTMSGVVRPTRGEMRAEGRAVAFASPRDAMTASIATVQQDFAMIPLMSVARNFFMGREPTKGWGPFKRLDVDRTSAVTMAEMRKIGISLREADQAVGPSRGAGARR